MRMRTVFVPYLVTKMDVPMCLATVCGVQTTYIRKDNYIVPLRRDWNGAWGHNGKSFRTYKRAVVGLVEPMYHVQARKDMMKEHLLVLTRKQSSG